jgi:hypothetical protein
VAAQVHPIFKKGHRMQTKICRRCGGTFEEAAFFRKDRSLYASSESRSHTICIGCEQTARDTRKQGNRWLDKARDTLRRHADRFLQKGLIQSKLDLVSRYGWDVGRLAQDAEHAYRNGCPYCHRLFKEMTHGLSDITLDIVDPGGDPYYSTNTKWVCQTCNREKGRGTALMGSETHQLGEMGISPGSHEGELWFVAVSPFCRRREGMLCGEGCVAIGKNACLAFSDRVHLLGAGASLSLGG